MFSAVVFTSVKGGILVHHLVVEAGADLAQLPLQVGEVDDHPNAVQLARAHVGTDAPVMAVEALALAAVHADSGARR